MNMRSSRVNEIMKTGKVAKSIKLNLCDPQVAEIASQIGFDCIWVDMEHVPNTLKDVNNLIRAAKIYNVDTLVRVKRGNYSNLIHPLEMDAAGVMVPHVMSAHDAKEIVKNTRFHPIGRRPIDGGNADGGYCKIPVQKYISDANSKRIICVQIEDPESLNEIEDIAQIPGISMLFFGPGDFSQGIGYPGEVDRIEVLNARERVAKIARKYDIFAGTTGNPENFQSLIDMGYQFINIGADIIGLNRYFESIFKEVSLKNNLT
jgi:4-hydroxy-2-oxoheptanedioate aldolase